ncbi:ATP-binding protein [Acidovorax sp. NCPPB 2350]|nr:ATP-binding protein [Acidovorax sp. NCPPB 2350]
MQPRTLPLLQRIPFTLKLMGLGAAMVAIFIADTATRYEVAAAVFYTVVILVAARLLSRRALIALAALCIAMTALSLAFTPQGNLRSGLINMGISMTAIVMTTYLVLKMEAARKAAHDAQAQLMRIARVQSLESLTTSIAHEVNQPLAAIVTSGHACQRWLAQQPPNIDKASQALDRILSDAGRASSIIARVRSLTRGEPPRRQRFDLHQTVLDIVDSSQAEIDRNGIRLAFDLPDDVPPVMADHVQIQQVIGNLVLNAVEALAGVDPPLRRIRLASRWNEAEVVLTVSDSASGIPSGMEERVFDAFWTTKHEGIGVGLSISRTIIEANGGRIWTQSSELGGAAFSFSLPAAPRDKPP